MERFEWIFVGCNGRNVKVNESEIQHVLVLCTYIILKEMKNELTIWPSPKFLTNLVEPHSLLPEQTRVHINPMITMSSLCKQRLFVTFEVRLHPTELARWLKITINPVRAFVRADVTDTPHVQPLDQSFSARSVTTPHKTVTSVTPLYLNYFDWSVRCLVRKL